MRWTLATAALATAFLVAAAMSGPHSRGALTGASIAGGTAVLSVLAMVRTAGSRKPMKAALAVVAVAFLVRLVLVALGTAFVITEGESVVAFVVAFFVPFFAFAGLEAALVHSLRHRMGAA